MLKVTLQCGSAIDSHWPLSAPLGISNSLNWTASMGINSAVDLIISSEPSDKYLLTSVRAIFHTRWFWLRCNFSKRFCGQSKKRPRRDKMLSKWLKLRCLANHSKWLWPAGMWSLLSRKAYLPSIIIINSWVRLTCCMLREGEGGERKCTALQYYCFKKSTQNFLCKYTHNFNFKLFFIR